MGLIVTPTEIRLSVRAQPAIKVVVGSGGSGGGGGGTPDPHAASHENGGSDEIDVTGLTGLLATAQTPAAHKASHQNGGADELDLNGMSGLLADAQNPTAHKTSHQDGGSDEIDVTGLTGLLATAQTPAAHAASHKNGGSDEIASATPAASTIPKSGAGGILSSAWLDAILDAIAAAGAASANKMLYFTSASASALISTTSFGRSLLNAADAAALRTLAVLDNVTNNAQLAKDGSITATGDLNMGSHKVTNVTDPASAQDAATKIYVDNRFAYYGTYASKPAAGTQGKQAIFTDGVVPQIDDGSTWRNLVNGIVCKAPPAIATMTALNGGTLTVTDVTGTWKGVKTSIAAQTACYYQAGAGSTFKVTAAFSDLTAFGGVGNYTGQGVMMRESGTGKLVTWELQHALGSGLITMIRKRWTNATTFVSAIDNTTPVNEWKPIFLRIEYDGTNVIYRYSRDLTNWRTVTSEVKTTPFTTAPDQCGVSWYADGATGESYCVHYENI